MFQDELDACGVECLDLLLAHAVNSAHYDMYTRQGVFETAKELVAEGRARHFGISYHDGPELLDRILTEHPEVEAVQLQVNYEDWESPSVRSREAYEVAVTPVTAIENRYSMVARWHEPIFPACVELGVSYVAFSPMANGLLTGAYGPATKFEGRQDFREGMPQYTEEGYAKARALLDLLHTMAGERAAPWASSPSRG